MGQMAVPLWTYYCHPQQPSLEWEGISRGVRMFCPCLYSDPSQSDPETKDFWLNMAALTEALQHQAEQNPTASYYNLVLLRYQVGLRAESALGRGRAGRKNYANNRAVASALSCPLLATRGTAYGPGGCYRLNQAPVLGAAAA